MPWQTDSETDRQTCVLEGFVLPVKSGCTVHLSVCLNITTLAEWQGYIIDVYYHSCLTAAAAGTLLLCVSCHCLGLFKPQYTVSSGINSISKGISTFGLFIQTIKTPHVVTVVHLPHGSYQHKARGLLGILLLSLCLLSITAGCFRTGIVRKAISWWLSFPAVLSGPCLFYSLLSMAQCVAWTSEPVLLT